MMANLVGDHVRLGKVASCAEALLEITVKPEVDVRPLIGRTVKRPRCRPPIPARRVGPVREQHELGPPVRPSTRGKLPGPVRLRVVQNKRHKVRHLVFGCGTVLRGWDKSPPEKPERNDGSHHQQNQPSERRPEQEGDKRKQPAQSWPAPGR